MLHTILIILVLCLFFGVGFSITGLFFATLIWLFVKLPVSIILFVAGIICCCTIILIPVGAALIKFATVLFIPGIQLPA